MIDCTRFLTKIKYCIANSLDLVSTILLIMNFELIDSIFDLSNERKHTKSILVDLSKAFDTADQDILIKKLQLHHVQGNYLNWFKSYLANSKQYIEIKDFETEMLNIKCRIPQGSILGPLLFIMLFINDFFFFLSTPFLEPTILDDTNLFYLHQDIKELFRVANSEHYLRKRLYIYIFIGTEIGMIYL